MIISEIKNITLTRISEAGFITTKHNIILGEENENVFHVYMSGKKGRR